MMKGPVLVYAETSGETFRKPALEALTEGRHLADMLHVEEHAVAIGHGFRKNIDQIRSYGPDKIFHAEDPSLLLYNPDYYRDIMLEALKKSQPSIVLAAATSTGKDLTPRLAVHLNTGLATECVKLEVEQDELYATRPAYAGKVLLRVKITSSPKIVTLRPNVFTAKQSEIESKNAVLEPIEVKKTDSKIQVKEYVGRGAKKTDLTEASIIVSGGRGMGGPENYKILEELAEVLGGVVGASRASVDAGWRPHSDQVGQTGRTVSPTLYIAAGISGAIQHKVGMANSKVIVAINKDPEAPIFSFADYGILGDVFEIVPALTQELKKYYGKN
jgi:electron transfer flavoprotein alpha subunit